MKKVLSMNTSLAEVVQSRPDELQPEHDTSACTNCVLSSVTYTQHTLATRAETSGLAGLEERRFSRPHSARFVSSVFGDRSASDFRHDRAGRRFVNIIQIHFITVIYDHRSVRTGHPVRSAIHKH